MMKFIDLLLSCGNWDETSRLVVVYDGCKASTVSVKEARQLFDDKEVYWFRDNVVMLL